MSKIRKIILISLINITIILWLTFIYSVYTHVEDSSLINYKSLEEESRTPKKPELKEELPDENDTPGF